MAVKTPLRYTVVRPYQAGPTPPTGPYHPRIRDGDYAYAWQIQQLWDLLYGLYPASLNLTGWSHPTIPTLTIANGDPAGSALVILGPDGTTPVVAAGQTGFTTIGVDGYLDVTGDGVAPPTPAAGTSTIRIYERNGGLYFKVAGSDIEEQFPIGPPPSTHLPTHFFYGS